MANLKFLSNARSGKIKIILKMLVEPKNGGPLLDAIAFNIDTRYYPDLSIKQAKFAYKLEINEFRGNRNLQLLVDYIEPIG